MIDHILRAFRTGLLWLAAGLLLSACDTNRLEYDRMTGTAFPQAQTVAGATVTLNSIYAKAGFVLDVQEDTTSIPALPHDFISEAELDALEAAYRSTPVEPDRWYCSWWIFRFTCQRYYLWGVVVNHYYKDNAGVGDIHTMGRMWTQFNTSGINRRAFANFYKNATVAGDPGRYLRSTAHEIGHAFNLHHEDGADEPQSLMNTTGSAGANYTYSFSANSMDHLKNHPTDCVRPGAGLYNPVTPTCHTHSPYAAVPNPVCK
jgi:hypothetical protein